MTDDVRFERLRALGWTDARFGEFHEHLNTGLAAARVVAVHRGVFVVDDGTAARRARISGRLRLELADEGRLPTVGDWVAVQATPDATSATLIHALASRTSALQRKEPGRATRAQVLAANVDTVLLAESLGNDLNVRRLQRGVALAWESGATPVVVLTKADLCDDVEGALRQSRGELPGVNVVAVSTVLGTGLEELCAMLRARETAVLLGPSGVGKSTLLNALLGEDRMRTGDVRQDGKGRHTTTHRQLLALPNGALIVDTPGVRELALWGDEESVDATFDDIGVWGARCRFRDCTHTSEPGCAVLAAVQRGELAMERLEHWRKLRAELTYLASRDDRRLQSQKKRRDAEGARAGRARTREKWG